MNVSVSDGIAQVNALASNTAMTAWNSASDFLIVLVLFAIFFLLAWYIGRAVLLSILVAFYAAYAVFLAFPYTSFIPTAPAMTALLSNLVLYFFLATIFYLVLRRVVVSDFLDIGLFGTSVLALLGATFLIAMAYHVFPVADVYTFTPAMDLIFAPQAYFFWWFSAPALGLFFLAR